MAAILAGVIILLALLSHGILFLVRGAREGRTGFAGARWIWFSASPERRPVHFTALSQLFLSAPPRRALARIFVDRRFILWVNGVRAAAGGHRPGDAASAVDVASLLRPGRNSVAILAESPDGIGGVLFALDLGGPAPALVSDAGWSIDPNGLRLDPPGPQPAAVLGKPPLYPWGWRALETGEANQRTELRGRGERKSRDRSIGAGSRGLEQRLQVSQQVRNIRGVEPIAAKIECKIARSPGTFDKRQEERSRVGPGLVRMARASIRKGDVVEKERFEAARIDFLSLPPALLALPQSRRRRAGPGHELGEARIPRQVQPDRHRLRSR